MYVWTGEWCIKHECLSRKALYKAQSIYLVITVLSWPTNSSNLNIADNKHPPQNTDELKASISNTSVPHWCSDSCQTSPNKLPSI